MANNASRQPEQLVLGDLFPILPSARPSGIAKLAEAARHADDGHLIEFRAMQAKSLMNFTTSRRMGWTTWSINPYRGCEFGCKYCYARYTHQFLQPETVAAVPPGTYAEPEQPWAVAFEREIYLKENAAWLLEQELRRFDGKYEIAIGTATDPYQPIEQRVGITRSLLEVLAKREGLGISIVTKSRLIERDVDLLRKISERNQLTVHLTITTTDTSLARLLEPRAPRPDLRFLALQNLRRAGIPAGVLCSPLMYGLNDSQASIDAVAERAADAGACFLRGAPLFLKSCSRPTYLSFVREHFPQLSAEYERRFATMDFADPAYRRLMSQRIQSACRRYGLERAEELERQRKGPKAERYAKSMMQTA
ncbi:radical SAM protein [Granulicella cerasi]|uniref:Radical SAM protein n=1 Tax=Granulicella cerasi TaxID=741063 RepID=A0ABW1Z7I9_9BACT|nr:radical SAM protein [Granulicella cerasi]